MKKRFYFVFASIFLIGQIAHAEGEYIKDCYLPFCEDKPSIVIGADWLYWKAEQGNMVLGSLVRLNEEGTLTEISSEPLQPDFKETSGYRIFADYEFFDTAWAVEASFTHFPSTASLFATATPIVGSDFITLFFPPVGGTIPFEDLLFSSFFLSWDLELNYFDFDFRRDYFSCGGLQISPHLGLRVLWLTETLNINATGIAPDSFLIDVVSANFKEKVNAVGIEGGFYTSYQLGWGFSLLGHLGGSLLYYDSHTHLDAINALGTPSPSITTLNYKDSFLRANPTVDTFIGAYYEKAFCHFIANIHIGWENHIIFDTNQFSINGSGDLTLQGLTLGGSIRF